MLRKKIFLQGLKLFSAAFPAFEFSKDRITALYTLLKDDIDDKQFLAAIIKICKERREIRQSDNLVALILSENGLDPESEALESWQKIRRLISAGALERRRLSETENRAIDVIGGIGYLLQAPTSEMQWLRRDYINAFMNYSKREKTKKLIGGLIDAKGRLGTGNNLSE